MDDKYAPDQIRPVNSAAVSRVRFVRPYENKPQLTIWLLHNSEITFGPESRFKIISFWFNFLTLLFTDIF